MSAAPNEFLSQVAHVDAAAVQPFPNSRKVYLQGSRPDIRVPMREVSLSPTPTSFGKETNLPVYLYDTSGPYTDPTVTIDVRKGLPDVRSAWIEARGDTELLSAVSSAYGRERADDPKLAHLRFAHIGKPRRAKAGMNVSQMHYAQRGIITPEMEYIALRENMRLEQTQLQAGGGQHPRSEERRV